jgi:hypothetical protein
MRGVDKWAWWASFFLMGFFPFVCLLWNWLFAIMLLIFPYDVLASLRMRGNILEAGAISDTTTMVLWSLSYIFMPPHPLH